MSESDENLVRRFRQTAQREVLEILLNRHLATVRSMVFQMLLDHHAADDVTQEIFLRVVRGLDTFEGRSQFSTWLYQITMNVVRSHLTTRGRRQERLQYDLPEESTAVHAEPGGTMLQTELKTKIETSLAQLSPQLRAAIVLVCLQGQSAAEAATIENCSTETMYWRVHEARKQLKTLLAEYLQ